MILKVLLDAYFLLEVIPFLVFDWKLGLGPSTTKVISPPKSVNNPT